MKLKNKNMSFLLLKFMLTVYFSYPLGHKLCNKHAWDQIKDNLKTPSQTALEPYESIFLVSKGTGYQDPDTIDGGSGDHLRLSFCDTRANSLASNVDANPKVPKLGQVYNSDVSWYISAALHYVQDMSCPVHNPAIWNNFPNSYGVRPDYFFGDNKDNTSLHKLYESPSSYGISCTSGSSCASISDVYNKIAAAETRLTGIEGVGSKNGVVFTGTPFKEHLVNRLKGWYPILNSGNVTNIKNRLIEDIAFACCVQKTFWKGHSNLKNWFK